MFANRKTRTKLFGMFSSAVLALAMSASAAFAGGASSNASASGSPYGPGSASAGANATGNGINYAKTNTRTGNVNFGRGIAVSVDESGVNFSASNALAGRFGNAIATNLNISIGRDGSVASSHGVSLARGGLSQEVSSGGFAKSGRGPATSGSTVGGRTLFGGRVDAKTDSRSSPPRYRW